MAHPLSHRPTYTRDQLAQYVHRINGPNSPHTLETLEAEIAADPLAALATLQKKQLAGIPWGNIAMHYSTHKTLSLEPDALFTKIVERGLGGYCMENNSFFATVLGSLGYDLYITGARVSNMVEMNGKHPEGFGGWYVFLFPFSCMLSHFNVP
jgi:arylamine N-acetyltransferase